MSPLHNTMSEAQKLGYVKAVPNHPTHQPSPLPALPALLALSLPVNHLLEHQRFRENRESFAVPTIIDNYTFLISNYVQTRSRLKSHHYLPKTDDVLNFVPLYIWSQQWMLDEGRSERWKGTQSIWYCSTGSHVFRNMWLDARASSSFPFFFSPFRTILFAFCPDLPSLSSRSFLISTFGGD